MTSGSHRAVNKLESVWQAGSAFLDSFELKGEVGTFFHPVSREEDLPDWAVEGVMLSVQLRFVDRDMEINVHARIAQRVTSGDRTGLLLTLLEEQRDRQELILTCASGQSLPYFRRQHPRIPCELPVLLRLADGREIQSEATSISKGGIFLAMDDFPVGVEAVIHVLISFPDDEKSWRVRGRVASVVRQGPQPGLGIEFLFSSKEQRDAVHEHIRRLWD